MQRSTTELRVLINIIMYRLYIEKRLVESGNRVHTRCGILLTHKDLPFTLSVMPYRFLPFITGQTYHIFNRSVARLPIFLNASYYSRMLDVINYYRFDSPDLRFSHYQRLPVKQKTEVMQQLESSHKVLIEISAFCLMPNHIHFLIRQTEENGISLFMRRIQNSYAKYFNTRTKRSGALFQAMFKCVRMESDEQYLHVSRYIHLNPYTSFLVKDIAFLKDYLWSSYASYMETRTHTFVTTDFIKGHFATGQKIKAFTEDQADYQRVLGEIKHLIFDNPDVSS